MPDLNKVTKRLLIDEKHGRLNKHDKLDLTNEYRDPYWYSPYHFRRIMKRTNIDGNCYMGFLYWAEWKVPNGRVEESPASPQEEKEKDS